MIHTAAKLSSDHALNIHDSTNSLTLSIASATTGPASSLSVARPSTSAKPAQQFQHSTLLEGSYYRGTSQLRYGDKVKLSFAVTESYRAHFILIKGLLEFHRSPEFVFSFNREEGTFDVTALSARLAQPHEVLNKFLQKVAVWLDQELSFKRQLKEMIAFEREYRAKLAKVYAGGDGFTLVRVS